MSNEAVTIGRLDEWVRAGARWRVVRIAHEPVVVDGFGEAGAPCAEPPVRHADADADADANATPTPRRRHADATPTPRRRRRRRPSRKAPASC